jgi:hypothetical protein
MALTAHVLHCVHIDIAGGAGSDVDIGQITDFSISTAIQELLLGSDGAVDPTFVAVGEQRPRAAFTTSMLATVLAKCGISGLAIAADVDEFGADMFFKKVVEGGTRETGSNHLRLRIAKGLLVPRTLNAPHNGLATLGLELIATHDGTNNPIVIATSQALAGTAGVSEAFTAGPVYINGVQLEGVQNISIDFGITEMVLGSDGLVWPTYVAILDRKPVIRVRTIDALALNTFGLTGAAQGITDSLIYLRKISQGGTRVANATAEHIKVSVDEGLISVDTVRGSHPNQLESEVTIRPTYDDANAILAVTTASAIA